MHDAFLIVALIGKILSYSIAGYVCCRFFISKKYLDIINDLTYYVVLPSLIFSNTLKGFSPDLLSNYWLLIFFQPVYMLIAYLLYKGLRHQVYSDNERKVSYGMYAFQNSGYMPIALFGALLTGKDHLQMLNLLFILLIGYNLAMFSVGEVMFEGKGFDIRRVFNIIIVTIISSMFIAGFGLQGYLPSMVLRAAELIGSITVPVVMFSLGGSIYYSSYCRVPINKNILLKLSVGKGLIMPILSLLVILVFQLKGYIALLVFIQAIMPPAANLVILSRNNQETSCLVGNYLFYTYLFAMVYLPLWLIVYGRMGL